MRRVDDLIVYESVPELLDHLPKMPKLVARGGKNRHNYYLNCTCTFDTETTNTHEAGFIWSYQFNISGVNCVLRTYPEFVELLKSLCKVWKIGKNAGLKIHVHNLGYESWYLLQLLERDFGVKKALFTSSHKVLSIRLENGIEFLDSLKLFQKSLAGATKGCKHPKAKGDLDYKVYHDAGTPLTDAEYRYIVYDVQGLYEAIERLKAEGGYNAATLPITNTSRVLGEVCKQVEHSKGWQALRRKLALNASDLKLAYECMAGGDTHGNRRLVNRTLTNCNSYDFKSAHPSQMLTKKFPMGQPTYLGKATKQDLLDLIRFGYGWIGHVALTNVNIIPACPDPVISYSKCQYTEDRPALDNGRILNCSGLVVPLDSNDFQRVNECYTYDSLLADNVVIFKLDYLPPVFRAVVKSYFEQKEQLPKDTPEYNFSKICVNTIFGAAAQRTIRDEYIASYAECIEVKEESWCAKFKDLTDNDAIKSQDKSGKLPFLWGLWTASCSRLELWKLIKAVGWDRAIYWDTDSCKYIGDRSPAVNDYNSHQIELVKAAGADVQNRSGGVSYIGVAEDEHPQAEYGYKEFRALHAKCYAARDCTGELVATIAGVSKEAGRQALQDNIYNLHDGFIIDPAGGQKLWYYTGAIGGTNETPVSSWIYMEDRNYKIGFAEVYDAMELDAEETEITAE